MRIATNPIFGTWGPLPLTKFPWCIIAFVQSTRRKKRHKTFIVVLIYRIDPDVFPWLLFRLLLFRFLNCRTFEGKALFERSAVSGCLCFLTRRNAVPPDRSNRLEIYWAWKEVVELEHTLSIRIYLVEHHWIVKFSTMQILIFFCLYGSFMEIESWKFRMRSCMSPNPNIVDPHSKHGLIIYEIFNPVLIDCHSDTDESVEGNKIHKGGVIEQQTVILFLTIKTHWRNLLLQVRKIYGTVSHSGYPWPLQFQIRLRSVPHRQSM